MKTNKNKPEEADSVSGLVKEVLANQIGVEPQDIKIEDSLSDDLHMSPADISDFVSTLGDLGVDTTKIDLTTIKTVSDLIECLNSVELIE